MILTDIHCHILPGVDDGAPDMTVTKDMLVKMYDKGVRRIIATPHYRVGMFEPSVRSIQSSYLEVKNYARTIGKYGMMVKLGCEYHRDDNMVGNLQAHRRPTMAGSQYVLVEFSSMDSYLKIRSVVYEVVVGGFIPIIAHIERYPSIVEDPGVVADLIGLGALIQINADSMLGMDGRKCHKFCKYLMKREQVHFIGSDAHDLTERPSRLKECAVYVEKKWGWDTARRIFVKNPEKILNIEGEDDQI